MNSPATTFWSWLSRTKDDRLAQWEHTRKSGKWRFVARTALIWGGAMILLDIILNYLFDRGPHLVTVIYFAVAAPIVALVIWWSNEGEYTNAKLDRVMKRYR